LMGDLQQQQQQQKSFIQNKLYIQKINFKT